ncbi:MAG TPA: sugar transferase [bacterium]|nr:sugar transferase [bacterium]
MFRRFGPNYMVALYLFDLGAGQAALWAAQCLRGVPLAAPITAADAAIPGFVRLLVVIFFAVIFPLASLYDGRRVYRAVDEAERVVLGVSASSLILAGAMYFSYRDISRIVFLQFVVLAVVLLLGCRAVLRLAYRMIRWGTHVPVVLIAGTGALGNQVARLLASAGIAVAGFVDDDPATRDGAVDGRAVLGDLEAIPAIVERHKVTDVVFAVPRQAQERIGRLLVSLWTLPLHVYTIPDFFDVGVARVRMDYLGGIPVIGLREPVIDGFQRVAKRLVDLGLGTVISLCVLPVAGLVSLLIRLDSPGPVIFRQQRVGENGRLFTMFKFRTMVTNAEAQRDAVISRAADGKIVHKRRDDPRVTRVGRVLRRLSLDELPQLINVLRGDMSLVGPRPEMPWIVAQYDPWQYQRLAVPQGMTSWYVVNGRSEVPMHMNTEQDLRYVRNCSLLEDFKILVKSVGSVVKGRGAF